MDGQRDMKTDKQKNRSLEKVEREKNGDKLRGVQKYRVGNQKENSSKEEQSREKTNPKAFYQFINKARLTKSKIGPLIDKNDEVVTDPKQQAEMFNGYYTSEKPEKSPDATKKSRGHCYL